MGDGGGAAARPADGGVDHGRRRVRPTPFSGQVFFFFAPLFIPLLILGVPILDTLVRHRAPGPRRAGVADRRQGAPPPPPDAPRPRPPAQRADPVGLDACSPASCSTRVHRRGRRRRAARRRGPRPGPVHRASTRASGGPARDGDDDAETTDDRRPVVDWAGGGHPRKGQLRSGAVRSRGRASRFAEFASRNLLVLDCEKIHKRQRTCGRRLTDCRCRPAPNEGRGHRVGPAVAA